MEQLPVFTLVLIVTTVIVSLWAFQSPALREKLIFEPRAILERREHHRLLTAAWLHLDGNHLFGNLFTLYFFGRDIELVKGAGVMLGIYFASILGGGVLSLWLHRRHEYRALGASGGVCGILFAWILFFPGGHIFLFLIPVGIPGWLYAIGYLAYSFFALKHGRSNVGHDAHLGGAVIGLLLAAALQPAAVAQSPWLFTAILAAGSVMFLYLWKNPLMLPLKHFLPERRSTSRPPPPRRPISGPTEAEVNAVLEKVSRAGVQSLSAKERRILEQAARK